MPSPRRIRPAPAKIVCDALHAEAAPVLVDRLRSVLGIGMITIAVSIAVACSWIKFE